jgi:N-acetylmuramoyl-L-alanine amidase
VLKSEKIVLYALVALAGCSTTPSRPGEHPSERKAEEENSLSMETEHVSDSPIIAPPPAPLPAPATPSPKTNYADIWIPLNRWSRENQVGTVERIAVAPLHTFSLTTSNSVFILSAKSLVAKWNGLELRLGFEPQLIGDQLFVHTLDLKKNIEPLVLQQPPSPAGRVIVIDPGHGGQNSGTKSVVDGTDEKEFTLDWGQRLEQLLATNGWQVFLTRTNDVDMSLPARIAFAEEHKADLFISLHFNSAAPSQEQAGLETFCLTPQGMPSTLTRGYEDNVSLTFTNNMFDVGNLQYAVLFHRALLKDGELADRGVRRARFLGVLRGQNRPAVLIEGGYLSNPSEARRIADPAHRQKLAEAVAHALMGDAGSGSAKPESERQPNNDSLP